MVRPLVSTVVATDMEGFLDHSLDRLKYRASEMPQAFTYNVIKSAYEKVICYQFIDMYILLEFSCDNIFNYQSKGSEDLYSFFGYSVCD